MNVFRTRLLAAFPVPMILLATAVPSAWCGQAKADQSAGESLYKSHCVLCHGSDASGNTTMGKQLKAPNLHSKEVQRLSESEIKSTVLNGKGNMPPFDGQISGEEAAQVARYVRSLSKMK